MNKILDFIATAAGVMMAGAVVGGIIAWSLQGLNYAYVEIPSLLFILSLSSAFGAIAYSLHSGEMAYMKIVFFGLLACPIMIGIIPKLKSSLSMVPNGTAEEFGRSMTTIVVTFSCVLVCFTFLMCLHSLHQKKRNRLLGK